MPAVAPMTFRLSGAFFYVGIGLVLLGLVVLLAAPEAGLLMLLLAAVHLLIGLGLRRRERRPAS